ncbi:MAG TPA: TrkA family potassium uptake protein [Sporosarcina sp.]|nr:TrkA family potassium uptake protein [Sporosarcina sp.]
MKKEYVVIGLGRFGGSIVSELMELEVDVMAVDINPTIVDEYADIATQAVVADTTDEAVLKSLGIHTVEHVIVAIGENIQASILTTLILKELGVPYLTVKAQNDHHEKVLRKVGADKIVRPERDMGVRVANNVVSNNILDYLELSEEHSIAELHVSGKIVGHSLIELDVRAKYGVNIVAIRRKNDILVSPQANEELQFGDILIIIGSDDDIHQFEKKMFHF